MDSAAFYFRVVPTSVLTPQYSIQTNFSRKQTLWRGRILGRNWDKSLQSFSPFFYSLSPPLTEFTPPPPSKMCLKLVCNINIVFWKPQV